MKQGRSANGKRCTLEELGYDPNETLSIEVNRRLLTVTPRYMLPSELVEELDDGLSMMYARLEIYCSLAASTHPSDALTTFIALVINVCFCETYGMPGVGPRYPDSKHCRCSCTSRLHFEVWIKRHRDQVGRHRRIHSRLRKHNPWALSRYGLAEFHDILAAGKQARASKQNHKQLHQFTMIRVSAHAWRQLIHCLCLDHFPDLAVEWARDTEWADREGKMFKSVDCWAYVTGPAVPAELDTVPSNSS